MRRRVRGHGWQVVSLALLVIVLVESGLLATQPSSTATVMTPRGPANVPLPPHSTLARTQILIDEGSQEWDYSVAGSSVDTVLSYYQAQTKRLGWRCYSSMTMLNNQQGGQPISGVGVYISAVHAGTKIQVVSGDLIYGSNLVGEPLATGSVGLRIVLEPADATACDPATPPGR